MPTPKPRIGGGLDKETYERSTSIMAPHYDADKRSYAYQDWTSTHNATMGSIPDPWGVMAREGVRAPCVEFGGGDELPWGVTFHDPDRIGEY